MQQDKQDSKQPKKKQQGAAGANDGGGEQMDVGEKELDRRNPLRAQYRQQAPGGSRFASNAMGPR